MAYRKDTMRTSTWEGLKGKRKSQNTTADRGVCDVGFAVLRRLAVSLMIMAADPLTVRSQVVAGYYPDWAAAVYPPSAIKMENLTHIIHAFAWPNPDGSISYDQGFLSIVPALTQRAHAAGKKVLVSLGGYD